MTAVKPSDWTTQPMPERHITLALDVAYAADEMDRIREGLLPHQMEDKWFVYWQGGSLYFHRSWTGCCIYIVRFEPEGSGWRMVEADVNRDTSQYLETDDERDRATIPFLIDLLLLRRPLDLLAEAAPAPAAGDDGGDAEDQALRLWSSVGRAMHGQHPDPPA